MKKKEKIVLAFSGGLDTSIILKWLQNDQNYEVVTFTADIGQGGEIKEAKEKAEKLGVKEKQATYYLELVIIYMFSDGFKDL